MNIKNLRIRAGKITCSSHGNFDPECAVSGHSTRRLRAGAALGILALLIAGCAPKASVSEPTSPSPTTTATETSIDLTTCTNEKETKEQGADEYVCTLDNAGALVWMEASASKKLVDERVAAAALLAAKKAAEEKAAAEKLAAQKAAAQKAAAEKAAAQKAAAERAAAAKRAAEAAAAQAAADAAARAAAEAAAQQQAAQQQAQQSSCDPNYAGACVPIASDVDCAGGSGNGPAYVQGPVRVVGSDIYGLDRDGDGIGCE